MIYTYMCPKCKRTVELSRSLRDHEAGAPRCVEPGCDGQQEMAVQLQPAALVFKGSGWTPKGR